MDRELHHELRPKRLEQYRDEAKALLRAFRAGDAATEHRAREALGDRVDERFVLADALHVIAREHGHRSWPAFKREAEEAATATVHQVGRIGASPATAYAEEAQRLLAAARRGEQAALERLRARVPRLSANDDAGIAETATSADARVCLAHEYGFRTWAELAEATDRAHDEHYSRLPAELPWKQAEAAIQVGDAARLRQLLAEHPGLERQDHGMTLLSAAAQPEAGDVPREIVDLLVEAGSDIQGPLNIAACFNKRDMVGWLLDAGADAASTEVGGFTPLQTAAYHGSREAADLLVRRTGLLPDTFYIAAVAGDLERLAEWFDSAGALKPEAARERPNLSDVGWPPRPPASDEAGEILAEALSLAAHVGRTEACEFLLDQGADPARAPFYGLTPLHFAARTGRYDTARLLVDRGAPLDARDAIHGGTPLGWARHNAPYDTRLLGLLET